MGQYKEGKQSLLQKSGEKEGTVKQIFYKQSINIRKDIQDQS